MWATIWCLSFCFLFHYPWNFPTVSCLSQVGHFHQGLPDPCTKQHTAPHSLPHSPLFLSDCLANHWHRVHWLLGLFIIYALEKWQSYNLYIFCSCLRHCYVIMKQEFLLAFLRQVLLRSCWLRAHYVDQNLWWSSYLCLLSAETMSALYHSQLIFVE